MLKSRSAFFRADRLFHGQTVFPPTGPPGRIPHRRLSGLRGRRQVENNQSCRNILSGDELLFCKNR